MTRPALAAERELLAARQATLLDALLDGGPPPLGVDPERVRVQAHALVAKHAYSAARKQPPAPAGPLQRLAAALRR